MTRPVQYVSDMTRRRETPTPRVNPGGKKVWVARWTDKTGKRRYGWPPTIAGTYRRKGDAQDAIDLCYERDAAGPERSETVGGYFATWTQRRPRSKVTDRTNEGRIKAVLDVKLEGAPLRDWPFEELRRRHATALVDHMFRVQGRAHTGIRSVIGSLSSMTEDAIEDEAAVGNPFKGVRVRANDPRAQKALRKNRVWTWQQMHELAAAAALSREDESDVLVAWRATYAEPMVRILSDCGLRIGELLALRRMDLDVTQGLLEVRQTASQMGEILAGTKVDHGEPNAGRVVPLPPVLCEMLTAMPKRIDTPLLFPAPKGGLWWYSAWSYEIWKPACKRLGLDPRPNEFRHSHISLLRAARIDPADLAVISGHSVNTQSKYYTHALGLSFDAIRAAVGRSAG